MAEDIAISVNDVSKMYKLYDNPMDRLKESLGLSRKRNIKSIMRSTMYPFRCIREKQWELSEQMVPANPRS